jgi:PAT family beta-lactamase induction signal transducer AmpG
MTKTGAKNIFAVFADRRMLIILLLGFSSGLPLALTGGTLQAWLTDAKLDVSTIGLFALVGLPYTMKFLWAPLLDRYALPHLGLRRGWGILTQIFLVLSVIALGFMDPAANLAWFSLVAFLIAFFSASQDIVVDAYRTEIIEREAYGAGSAVYTTGYRLAMVVSGGAALVMAAHTSWRNVFIAMALLNLMGAVTLYFSPEPKVKKAPRAADFKTNVVAPFLEFFQRHGAMEILLFVMLYKLSTMMATALTTKFLLDMHYTKELIGSANKIAGMIATIFGTLTGGALMTKFGLKRSLWIFGVIQSLVGITFWAMLSVAQMGEGWREFGMVSVIFVDYYMMGLGLAAIMGFMMEVCSKQFTGTQYALLSSLTAVTRVILVAHAGTLVEHIGWGAFFLCTVPLALPGLMLLRHYDQWQMPSNGLKAEFGLYEKVTVSLFMLSLIALSTDPFWRWIGWKDAGQDIVLAGAVGVLVVVCAGLLKPYLKPAPKLQTSAAARR